MLSLTGHVLLVVLALGTVAAPVVMARQVARPGPRDRFRRTTLVVAGQVFAVALTAAAANDYGDFYPTWGDLFGAAQVGADTPTEAYGATVSGSGTAKQQPHPGAAGRTISSADAHAVVAGMGPTGFSRPAEYATKGAVVHLPPPAGIDPHQEVLAYLPPSYFDGSNGNASLPMVELLTGYPGTPDTIVGKLHAPEVLLAGLRAGTLHPMVLLITRPVEPFPRDTECTDVPNGPATFDYLATTLPHGAAEKLSIDVTGLAAGGYSTGGYCALKLAMEKPETFVAAASMSGYYHALPGTNSGDLFGGNAHNRDLNDLVWRLKNLPLPRAAIMIATAKDERFDDGYVAAEEFLHLVRAPMSASAIVLPHGGHNFTTWEAEFPRLLEFLDHRFLAF